MKITAFSDTRKLHRNSTLSNDYIFIHAGDFISFGTVEEVEDFVNWFLEQPFKTKFLFQKTSRSALFFRNGAVSNMKVCKGHFFQQHSNILVVVF